MVSRLSVVALLLLLVPAAAQSQERSRDPSVRAELELLMAQAELSRTVASLARKKGEYERTRSNFGASRQAFSDAMRASEEWWNSRDQVGNFVLGYLIALNDRGFGVLPRNCGNINAADIGDVTAARLIAVESTWRRNWAEVLREWLLSGQLIDASFRDSICRGPN
jgi:hypothetical protein